MQTYSKIKKSSWQPFNKMAWLFSMQMQAYRKRKTLS